jgi:hypothetical protein
MVRLHPQSSLYGPFHIHLMGALINLEMNFMTVSGVKFLKFNYISLLSFTRNQLAYIFVLDLCKGLTENDRGPAKHSHGSGDTILLPVPKSSSICLTPLLLKPIPAILNARSAIESYEPINLNSAGPSRTAMNLS